MDTQEKKRILEQVKHGELSPQEGVCLIREIELADSEASANQPVRRVSAAESHQTMDIAVIGMAGRFPGARNLDEFWHRLANGEDCVTEIPPSRWDVEQFYSPDSKAPNKTYCRWSGMVPDADCFDPLFFNISPKEAQLMDPQQRLFLQESWRAIEDAGYAPLALSERRCGVFAGVMQGDYAEALRAETESLDAQFVAASGNCFLPARVAYFLNLTGPCMALDTACSSSLVAIHRACQAIVNGEIEIALAGGVSVIAMPYHHITSAKSEMLARDGRCKSFDDAADGFVPSEGVGVVMLKSLRRALADGDHIYGVIKGGRVNQDGRSNGISAPSANSQTRLLTEVYKTYGIDPEQISYVEAHGTGTKLGDPIEFTALTRAFRQFTEKQGYCAIGSVKSNIGHALAAAGVGGLIKVLLCMKHDRLVPSMHFRQANRHIDFENSPFYLNTTLRDWPRHERSRLAVVSSFGLSGTNCHLVLADAPDPVSCGHTPALGEHLMLLSARTQGALARCIDDLRHWADSVGRGEEMADIAYTLAAGRSHFKVRLAFTARNTTELRDKLHALADGEMPDNAWRGTAGAELPPADAEAAAGGRLHLLGQRYVKGADIDGSQLYSEHAPRRISLPGYPFERERYWLAQPAAPRRAPLAGATWLHPLLHENLSTLREQRFGTRFHGTEFFLKHHQINGRRVLPGVCCLLMARVAGEIAGECAVSALSDVNWLNPLVVEEGAAELSISLFAQQRQIGFEITQPKADGRLVHARGRIEQDTGSAPAAGRLDIAQIEGRCAETYSRETLYRRFADAGLTYGAPLRLIERLACGQEEALSWLGTPEDEAVDPLLFELPMLDAALQTVAGITGQLDREGGRSYLPFSLGRLAWLGPPPGRGHAHARLASRAGDNVFFDVTLTDDAGRIALICRDFAVRPAKEQATDEPGLMGLLQRLYLGEIGVEETEAEMAGAADPEI
ncbi:MAG: type I polyketide synthase [Candidatus Thiodiazotropha sp.]